MTTTTAKIEGAGVNAKAYAIPELLGKDVIKRDQDGIKKSLTKLDMAIHNNAVQCLMHAEKHGDTSLMRRLLVDIVDAKSGYRRQGIIAWMRAYSPMELKGDVINLSGMTSDGEKRPFKIEAADKAPFWTNAKFDEAIVKPVYRDSVMGKINAAIREFKAAVANTQDGKPIDPTKPFYDGTNIDKVDEFFGKVEAEVVVLSTYKDSTKDVRAAQATLKAAQAA